MEQYFQKFPEIYYKNVKIKDITRRVKISEETRRVPNVFYPLELQSGLRSDVLADAYYQDSDMDWLIYLTNNIVDPYYGWYLNEEDFVAFIEDKYGSLERAMKKIKFYRNNWYSDDTEITPHHYNNVLPFVWKKYYSPNFGPGSKVISYARKQVDWVMNTNQILRYEFSANSEFTEGEIIDIKYNGEVVGGGEVVFSNTSTLMIQHVSGNTSANSTHGKTLIGEDSGLEVNTNSVLVVHELISPVESKFWSPVSFYDYEFELNEAKKHLHIIDANYALEIAEDLRKKLKD